MQRSGETARMPARAVYAGILLVFALAVGSYFVYQISHVVLTLLLTLLFAVILSGPVNYLVRRGLGRGLALALVAGVAVLVLWLAGVMVAPAAEDQARRFAEDLPAILRDIEGLVVRAQAALGLETGAELRLDALPAIGQDLLSGQALLATADIGRAALTVISAGVVALIATVYLVIRPRPVVEGFVAFFPARWRPRTREVLGKVYTTVQRWLIGQMVAMLFIGVLSVVALSILGVPFALLLGIFSGLISFIPFLGAVVSAIPPILLALVDDPITALWVVVAYTAIQQAESQIIQPIVMSRAVALHPAVVIFGLLVMGTLFGIVGLLLAVPLVATIQVLVRELWVRRMDGRGEDPEPPPKTEKKGGPAVARKALENLRRLPPRSSRRRSEGGAQEESPGNGSSAEDGPPERGSPEAPRKEREDGDD